MDTKHFEEILSLRDWDQAEKMVAAETLWPTWRRDCFIAAIEFSKGNLSFAEMLLSSALAQGGEEFIANHVYAQVLLKKGKSKDAIPYARKAWELSGYKIPPLFLYLHTLLDNARVLEVLDLLDAQTPEVRALPHALLSRASCYRSMGRLTDARDAIQQLLRREPENLTALRIRADIDGDENSEMSVGSYLRLIRLQRRLKGRADNLTKWNASLHFLRGRRFKIGWNCWEAGLKAEVGAMARHIPPQIDRARLISASTPLDRTKWVIVMPEQGIGDQVLFMSGFTELLRESSRVLLVSDPRLFEIWRRSFPEVTVVQPGVLDNLEALNLDVQGILPYGSILPRFRNSIKTFPEDKSVFLVPNQELTELMRKDLTRLSGGRKVVGISWRGGFWDAQKRAKNSELRQWLEFLREDHLFISLQYGDITEDRRMSKELGLNLKFVEGIDFKQEIDKWFSLICAVDHVVSVSTALVHFAGAAGKTVDILMPDKQGPWILGNNDQDHLVYPNARILRPQSPRQQISDLLEVVRKRLMESSK